MPTVIPGGIVVPDSRLIAVSTGRRHERILVANNSVWPVAITSHFHFFEIDRRMQFYRSRAFRMQLDFRAGAAVRRHSGETKKVVIFENDGDRAMYGFNTTYGSCDTWPR